MVSHHFTRGALIFSRTEAPEGLYVVRQGTALFCLDGENGRRLLLKIIHPNELFGETVVYDARPAPVSVEARSDLAVSLVPARSVERLKAQHPEIGQALASVSAANMRALLDVLEELTLMPLRERAEACLRRLVRDSGSKAVDITQSEFAAMLGASRQAVNQVLAAMEMEGLVERQFKSLVSLI